MIIKVLSGVLWFSLLLTAHHASAQPANFGDLAKIPKLGQVRGLLSFSETHLAVWYWNVRKNQIPGYEDFLVIYERRSLELAEVFRLKSSAEDAWQRLIPLDGFLTGLTIQSSQSFTTNDAALVIASVEGKFQVVFSGGTSEIVDLNGDNIPEIFESMWPDGDGHPQTTTIHVWSGKTYTRLMKASWSNRFGRVTLLSVEKAARRFRNQLRAQQALGADSP